MTMAVVMVVLMTIDHVAWRIMVLGGLGHDLTAPRITATSPIAALATGHRHHVIIRSSAGLA
jgi:hypothetical protein